MNITLHQIKAFVAVVEQGSIQAGADFLHKTHPSIITAIKKLENELGFLLFNRGGYRSTLTEQGNTFHLHCKQVLNEVGDLKELSYHLRENESTEISVAIGDITPLAPALGLLHSFTETNKFIHLNLLFENLEGVNERLLEGEANIIIHYIDESDTRYDYRDFCKIKIIPVVAKGFLDIEITNELKYRDLKKYNQCIIRSTAKHTPTKDYFILNESPCITVGDQHTKKEIIMQKMAWGHMPLFLIEDELESGDLISIENEFIRSNTVNIVIARLQKSNYSSLEKALWEVFR